MNTEEALQDFYQEKIVPINEQFRAIKRKAWRLCWKTALGILIAGAILYAVLFFTKNLTDSKLLIACISGASIVLALCVLFWQLSKRDRIFKQKVVPEVVHLVDGELSYEPESYIDTEFYHDSQLYRSFDRCRGEDLIHGSYHGVKLAFSEFESEYKTTDDKGHTTWHTIFEGVFFAADFNKNFKGLTLVVPDVAEKFFGRSIGGLFQKLNLARPGKLIRMENVEFEKAFAVYSSDDIEARYILSPSLMERILALKKRYRTDIALSFRSSCIYIGIPTSKNFFEYKGGELTFQAIQQTYDDVMNFASIIDELNLNLRIWSKE